MREQELGQCGCKRKKCERHGRCGECMEHHKKDTRYPLPYCKQKEKPAGRKEPDQGK